MSEYNHICPVCSSTGMSNFFSSPGMPVHIGILWDSRAEALGCPRGDINLAYCSSCGFICNSTFDPALVEYSVAYDNSLFFSPLFSEYSRSLAERLIESYGVRNKDIIEIGCGKGDFLLLLCSLGNNRGTGFDPSYEDTRESPVATPGVVFIKELYKGQATSCKTDLICSRYVLEHIRDPKTFLTMIRSSLRNSGTVVYFEVPNALFNLRDHSIWDIIYEHCSYFSRSSLAHVFRQCGFEIRDIRETFEGQFLSIDAVAGNGSTAGGPDSPELADCVMSFNNDYRNKTDEWERTLERIHQEGRRAVVWGAGAKAVSFLNILRAGGHIEYVVDINPHKNGKYMPGTGQMVRTPEFLSGYRPEVVIIMNPIYRDEIASSIKAIGVDAETICV